MATKKTIKKERTNPYIDQLAKLGFSKAESLVYVYLLERGSETGVSKIAVGTGMHRQQVYTTIPLLVTAGIVEEVNEGKVSKYKAKAPQMLERVVRRKMGVAEDLAQALQKISKVGHEQDFEVLQGAQQIRQYEMDYVYDSVEGEREFILGGHSQGFADLMGEELTEYLGEKNKKRIEVLYLGCENERDFYKTSIGLFPNQEHRFMKELPQGVTHMVVRKDTVLFFSFLTPPLVYVIKSETVAENYKQIFMMLWEMAAINS